MNEIRQNLYDRLRDLSAEAVKTTIEEDPAGTFVAGSCLIIAASLFSDDDMEDLAAVIDAFAKIKLSKYGMDGFSLN